MYDSAVRVTRRTNPTYRDAGAVCELRWRFLRTASSSCVPASGGSPHVIDRARGDCAVRHALVLGAVILRESYACGSIDFLSAKHAVTRAAGQDDADRFGPAAFS